METEGWDSGQVYVRSVFPGEPNSRANQNTVQELYDFIQNFRDGNVFLYRSNLSVNRPYLKVDLQDITNYDAVISQKVVSNPTEILAMFEEAAYISAKNMSISPEDDQKPIPKIQIELVSKDTVLSLRDLNSAHVSKLVCVSGLIIGASTLSSKATFVYLQCKNCKHIKIIPVAGGYSGVTIPRICDKPQTQDAEKCPLDPYEIVPDKCIFVDQQTLKLQESPDFIPVGELPRHLGSSGAVAIRNPYLRIVGMEVLRSGNSSASKTFSPEEENEMLAISRIPNIYRVFADSIAPSIFGNSDIKKAITCLLFGGSKKVLPDGMRIRGDINVLLLGDPGTAKSQLLKFLNKIYFFIYPPYNYHAIQVAPISIYTSGKGSSAAGLTASVIKDPTTRELYLEGGAMVLADGGVVCIDEFDKMRDEDRVAIHEAMEQQTISIAKAGITTVLNARSSVLAAANPVFGRYDDTKAPGDNIDFQTTILSRFDCIFIVKDEHNEARDRTIAKHVLQIHASGAIQETAEGELSLNQMARYLTYCRSKCAPRLTPQAAERLGSFFVTMRSQISRIERDSSERSTIPITVRQLEAVVRLSESLAKISLLPVCTVEHVEEAIRLFRVSTVDAAQSTTGMNFLIILHFY
ncbi:DNA replication licensing factor mcm5 [Smittium culicis]|uniref:DNA replication licensing factor MCM5 n=1 Tax=Smittium culicis TaxID=133412 RepID=A0A1R1XKS3_9FUNG|nr:DNA replication licensing factor mcm5 [Smittium culicis]